MAGIIVLICHQTTLVALPNHDRHLRWGWGDRAERGRLAKNGDLSLISSRVKNLIDGHKGKEENDAIDY